MDIPRWGRTLAEKLPKGFEPLDSGILRIRIRDRRAEGAPK
jgi:hypothetical protein